MVDRIEFTFKTESDLSLSIETSINQNNWNEVASGEFVSGSVPETRLKIMDEAKVRFLRVNIIAKDKKAAVAIGEIEVFGTTE